VPRREIRVLTESDLPDAGRLLAERHTAHRRSEPLLSPRFEDVDVATAELAAALAAEDASGAVAVENGQVVGYLFGAPKPSPLWGPNVWVEAAGHAARDSETLRELYALAATRWVDEGRPAHFVLVPASEPALIDAWFRLAFGQQHAHGIRQVAHEPFPVPAGLTVRPATQEDIPVLGELEVLLPAHQGRSPTFNAGQVPSIEDAIAEYEEAFDEEDFYVAVCEQQGKVIGSAVGCALEKSSSHVGPAHPDNAGFLGFAAVLPEARGLGAGRALGEDVISWSGANGYDCVVTDWRVTNLLSSRAWPALGFRTTFLRLHRLVGY
jgi:GNAT superfamily N-acetyltransferase